MAEANYCTVGEFEAHDCRRWATWEMRRRIFYFQPRAYLEPIRPSVSKLWREFPRRFYAAEQMPCVDGAGCKMALPAEPTVR